MCAFPAVSWAVWSSGVGNCFQLLFYELSFLMSYSSCSRNHDSWTGGRKRIVLHHPFFAREVAHACFIFPSLQMNWKQRWAQPSNKPSWNHIPWTAWISAPPTAILTSWRCHTPKTLPQQGGRSAFALDGNPLLLVLIQNKVIISFQIILILSASVFPLLIKVKRSFKQTQSCQYFLTSLKSE